MTRIRKITGFPEYSITSDGRVLVSREYFNQHGGSGKWNRQWLKQRKQNSGYSIVDLTSESGKKTKTVHRLVAEHFILTPYADHEVNHKDGNKQNNNASNLEWVTRSENAKHMYESGLFEITDEHRARAKSLGKKKPTAEMKRKTALGNIKISKETAQAIKDEYDKNKTGQLRLGRMFNVCSTTAYKAARNKLVAYDLD